MSERVQPAGTTIDADWRSRRAAMIIAHPGHELRVHHWLELARPASLILTDGSGRTRHSRLHATTEVLQRVGARPGAVYGRFSDAEIYAAMLAGRHEVFVDLLETIADWLVAERIDYVAADALEGYNSSHDLCWYLANAACRLASRRGDRSIDARDFLLDGRPGDCPPALEARAICLQLDEAALARKLAAAARYQELTEEVDAALSRHGRQAFAVECLRPMPSFSDSERAPAEKPYYETYGEKQRKAGYYRHVIRKEAHLLPIARALWARAGQQAR